MTELLCKLFIKNYKNTTDNTVRAAYGTLSGIVGIIVNLLLFAGKFIIGTLSASIAITADAINNLSDAGSSVISIISFRISSKPADRDHPFGHARAEYIASMIVSFIILFIGITLLKDSVIKIIWGGEKTDPSIAAIIVLALSVIGKLWLFVFNGKLGRRIDSAVMKATAADSLSDALSTAAVLIATIIYRIIEIELDAYMGVIVSILILRAGIGILKEALNSIIGTAPDEELINEVKELIFAHPEALGIHDLVVHNYGPGRCFMSCHVEVDGGKDIFASHDVIDNIEKELHNELGVQGVIHLDPIAVGDPLTNELRQKAHAIALEIDEKMNIHDFRIVPGTTHTNLIFDVVVPFEVKLSDEAVCEMISERIKSINENYFAVITIDRQ